MSLGGARSTSFNMMISFSSAFHAEIAEVDVPVTVCNFLVKYERFRLETVDLHSDCT